MIIVVNHLTRMREGRICVAGVDPETRRHVRPVTKWGTLDGRTLHGRGGPFDMAHVVDLGPVEACPQKPHVEDYFFLPWKAGFVERFHGDDFWALLYCLGKPHLSDIFGDELHSRGPRAFGFDAGLGKASLGILRVEKRPRLYLYAPNRSAAPKLRMKIDDGRMQVDVAVTDLRLFSADHAMVNEDSVNRLARCLQGPAPVLLSMGLSRAYAARSEDVEHPMHWLQVNNIHLEKSPTWGFAEREE